MTYCLTQALNYDYHHTLPHYPTFAALHLVEPPLPVGVEGSPYSHFWFVREYGRERHADKCT